MSQTVVKVFRPNRYAGPRATDEQFMTIEKDELVIVSPHFAQFLVDCGNGEILPSKEAKAHIDGAEKQEAEAEEQRKREAEDEGNEPNPRRKAGSRRKAAANR